MHQTTATNDAEGASTLPADSAWWRSGRKLMRMRNRSFLHDHVRSLFDAPQIGIVTVVSFLLICPFYTFLEETFSLFFTFIGCDKI